MFSNLFFVILVMLLIGMAPDLAQQQAWEPYFSPLIAFVIGLTLYALTLLLIYVQNRVLIRSWPKNRVLPLVQLELLAFLFFYQVILAAPRWMGGLGSNAALAAFSLMLYFGGLAVFYASRSKCSAHLEIRLLIPFCLPFLFITLLFDLLKWAPISIITWLNSETFSATLATLGVSLTGLLIILLVLPFLIVKIWLCEPLQDQELLERLENLCQKAHFKHAGLKTWTVLNSCLTAAIIGITSKLRYILFTKRLLEELPPTSIEAILAHEIGHSYHKHLLLIPLVIFGLSLCLGLFSVPFTYEIAHFMQKGNEAYPSELWLFLYFFATFAIYALTIGLYFRLVFGLFSRLFERQADLHVFHLNVPSKQMIEALNYIGCATGNSHRVPNWHHYSIQQRIDFLEAAEQDPTLIAKHHRKVKLFWGAYLALLIVGCLTLFMVEMS